MWLKGDADRPGCSVGVLLFLSPVEIMFTGLVEGRGVVTDIRSEGPSMRITVDASCLPQEGAPARFALGESVSLNGCCLTVVDMTDDGLCAFQAGAETLSKTTLGGLRLGDELNLERALAANARLGGHFVQGHIDGTATVCDIRREDEWTTMWFRVPPVLTQGMVPKGSIAVDGVSLTLVDVASDQFSIALIPHTLQVTTLGQREVGDVVNIEVDILGKYVRRMLESMKA